MTRRADPVATPPSLAEGPADVLGPVLDRLRPDADERRALDEAVAKILERAREVADRMADEGHPRFEPLLVGSAAKDTWLHGHVDLDVFLLFPEALDREGLEESGLVAGRRILPDPVLKYAEHPYVHGSWEGYPADVVPAHAVSSPEAIKSAVDRTPYHNAYVLGALEERPELRDEVRLAKRFLKGIDCYGAETALGAVSGYLAEVLVIHHGGFVPMLTRFRDAVSGLRIDPTGRSEAAFPDDVLVVVDPVDPGRNAAAAVTKDRFDRLVDAARAFFDDPSERFFEPRPLPVLSPEVAEARFADRGAVVVRLPTPEMREDARIPHARRAAENLASHLEREGFTPVGSDGGLGVEAGCAFLFVETTEPRLPAERLHMGPPAAIEDRAKRFREKYTDHEDVLEGPDIKEVDGTERVYVRLRVRDRDVAARARLLLERGVPLAKHVDRARDEGKVRALTVAEAVQDDLLEPVLREVFTTVPPWARTGDPPHDYAPPDDDEDR